MRRFVVAEDVLEAVARGWQPLPETVYRHAIRVLRLDEGAKIELRGGGRALTARIDRIDGTWGAVAEGDLRDLPRLDETPVTLMPAVFKSSRFRWMLEKVAELGVQSVAPFIAERTTERTRKGDLARWCKIAEEATRQSGGHHVPPVRPPASSLAAGLDGDRIPGTLLFADPAFERGLRDVDLSVPLTLVTGPEGGLSARELDLLVERGATLISLGPRILRAETAPVAILSAIRLL